MGFDQSVTLLIATVATGVYRQLPRPDLHRLEHSAFHGALNNPGLHAKGQGRGGMTPGGVRPGYPSRARGIGAVSRFLKAA